ncbi:hypothetical protein DFH27DRAFT_599663 [Peziza echinospora]|nr:hypothetical protein DFH27DRAFT_599663 [Peziza echinospora]
MASRRGLLARWSRTSVLCSGTDAKYPRSSGAATHRNPSLPAIGVFSWFSSIRATCSLAPARGSLVPRARGNSRASAFACNQEGLGVRLWLNIIQNEETEVTIAGQLPRPNIKYKANTRCPRYQRLREHQTEQWHSSSSGGYRYLENQTQLLGLG